MPYPEGEAVEIERCSFVRSHLHNLPRFRIGAVPNDFDQEWITFILHIL